MQPDGQGKNVRSGSGCALLVFVLLSTGAAVAQITATVRPSAPISVGDRRAPAQKIGVHFNGSRVEFDSMPLRDLILYAYGVELSQLKGPEWLADRPYDIAVTMSAGMSEADAPAMLQRVLQTRFRLVVHRESRKQQVMALVIAKGGPKLSASATGPIHAQGAPVAHHDRVVGTRDGPVYVDVKGHEGSTVNASMTMPQFADLLTSLLRAGDNRVRSNSDMHEYQGDWQTVVDRTGLKGIYQVALESSLRPDDIVLRIGRTITVGGAVSEEMLAPSPTSVLDPAVFASVRKLGLRLELGNATVEQFVVDHVEKTPKAN